MATKNSHKNVLISGNGFDLSFGLPMKYTGFIAVMGQLHTIIFLLQDQ